MVILTNIKEQFFTDIIASGHTYPTLLLPLFTIQTYDRIILLESIKHKTAGTSEHRSVNIIDLTGGVDTQVNQFTLILSDEPTGRYSSII